MNIGIYIYDNAEVLDFSGPFEVFTTAKRVATTKFSNDKNLLAMQDWHVFLIAEKQEMVSARAGYSVKPNCSIDNHPPLDVLVVAGGYHVDELKKQKVITWLTTMSSKVSTLASVCTGAFLLAETGVLDGLQATTHWEDIADFSASYPSVKVVNDVRYVDAGKIVTSAGISAGLDMSLYLVSQFVGMELAQATARQMQYEWQAVSC